MIRDALLAGLFALATFSASAQPVDSIGGDPAPVRVSDSRYFADRKGEVSWNEIRSGRLDDAFSPITDTSFSGEVLTYWIAFTLRNEAHTRDRFFLEFEDWLYVDVYARPSRSDTSSAAPTAAMRTGRRVPFMSRNVPIANRNLVEIHLEPGQSQTYVARLHSDYSDIVVPSSLSFQIYTPDALWSGIATIRNVFGVFTGVYLILFLYSLFIYISTRDRNYLFYILLIGCLLLTNEWNSGYFIAYLQDYDEFMLWSAKFEVLLSSIFGILLLQFTRSFLHLKSELQLWDRIATSIMAVLVILPVPAFLGATFVAYNILSMVGLITCGVILTVAIKSVRARIPSASYFFLAYSFFFTGLAVYLLTDLGLIPSTKYSVFAIQFGLAAEGVLFSLALAHRINASRKENEMVLTEANRELLIKVRRRATEVEDQNLELAAQRDRMSDLKAGLAAANDAVRDQARQIEAAHRKLEQTLERLKTTHVQLAQRQKLASLGEFAAGIAHEVDNPLHFVNNFSDLCLELLDALEEDLARSLGRANGQDGDGERASQVAVPGDGTGDGDGVGNGKGDGHADSVGSSEGDRADQGNVDGDRDGEGIDAAGAAALRETIDLLRINLHKISEHGMRADGVVRSMLERSRGVEGERRSVDVNGLVDEYINLTVSGMRAKVADFDVEVERDYGAALGSIDLVPREIGRVLLNLLNNAFYAVLDRAAPEDPANRATVSVRTRLTSEGAVEIRVEDNGPGIDPTTASKIFQPFFTTKPTGEGTGLGLSRSHEIVTQMHGGSLTVERSPSGGAVFVIRLPATSVRPE